MKQHRILVADDERAHLEVLSQIFSSEGMSVIECVNGEEAVMKALAEKPALLVLDVHMPQKDGLQVLREIREKGGDWGKHVPAIFLTNVDDAQNVAGAMDLNAQDFLMKSDHHLKDILKRACRKLDEEC